MTDLTDPDCGHWLARVKGCPQCFPIHGAKIISQSEAPGMPKEIRVDIVEAMKVARGDCPHNSVALDCPGCLYQALDKIFPYPQTCDGHNCDSGKAMLLVSKIVDRWRTTGRWGEASAECHVIANKMVGR